MNQKKTVAKKKKGGIPDAVKVQVEEIIENFNRTVFKDGRYRYEAKYRGNFLYLGRREFGTSGPICRLKYTGQMDDWEFAIYKYSSETYDPNEWWFPGSDLVDGTVEGAMKAGLEAYP